MRDNAEAGTPEIEASDAPHNNSVEESVMAASARKSTVSPAFQFYPKDFLASSHVDNMSMVERGMYITLLSKCWLEDGLPIEIPDLAKRVRMTSKQFAVYWGETSELKACFYEKEGKLRNRRLDEERKKQREYRTKQKEKADKMWQSRRDATALPDTNTRHMPVNGLQSSSSSASSISSSSSKEIPEGSFHRFQMAYPASRRKGGYRVETAFFEAFQKVGLDVLLSALANHIGSEQWRDPKLIPGMDTWLIEERWTQNLEASVPTQRSSSRLPAWAVEDAS